MDKRQIDKLLIRISCGDNDALDLLYQGTKRGVFSFLYSYLGRYEDAEDAMQTVYLKVKLNADKYRHGSDGRAWLLQIAKNTAINQFNKSKRLVYLDEIEVNVEQEPSCGINEIMKRILSKEEMYIVTLHVLWGYKHKETAKELNCPTGTVTSKYKRSIEKLKEALKEGEK